VWTVKCSLTRLMGFLVALVVLHVVVVVVVVVG
jgi:hypothetical protein